MVTDDETQEVLAGYITCALWASTDQTDEQGGNPLDANYSIGDIELSARTQMESECREFLTTNEEDIERFCDKHSLEQVGHDLWLTRNHHGAGFWDRDEGKVGDKLTTAAHALGESDLVVYDDGKLAVYPTP
jgi:hypothetical protein